ncbi:MAG: aminotransferase class IV [Candidatus Omnitrophota bacterium]
MLYSEKLNGVFETMRAYNGKPFMLDEHINRLLESSKTSGIKISLTSDELKRMVNSALKRKGYKDAYIRFAVDADEDGKIKFNIIVKETKTYPKGFYVNGVSVVTAATRRNPVESQNPKVKSSCFLNGISAKLEGLRHFESIMLDSKGLVTEGTISNIFIVKGCAIFTPPTYLGVLDGITRTVILKLAKKKGIKTYEVPFTRHELFNADECFLTNTSMEIMPVVNCDGRKIGSGRPGPITNMLRQEFRKMIERR